MSDFEKPRSKREARDHTANLYRQEMARVGRNISHTEARQRVDLAMHRTQRKKEG